MNLESFDRQAKTVLERFEKELSELRIGTASPALVEHVLVDAYGAKTPLVQLANIQIPEPRTIVIQPWDKNILKDIERALQTANIGASPVAEGGAVRISIPPLTEERRKEVVKEISVKKEDARVHLRRARDVARDEITKQEHDKKISEDEKFRLFKEIDKKTQEYHDAIEAKAKEKEAKVMKV